MSLQFLRHLDNCDGNHFSTFVSSLKHEPRIAWYPSAGTDFRALFYVNDAFQSKYPPINAIDPKEPDLFLYTDYGSYSETFEQILFHGANPIVHDDGRSKVTLSNIEQLNPLQFLRYADYRLNDENKKYFNRVFFFNATIESDEFGSITKPVLYAFSCNEQICSELLIPKKAKISHVIHVRYGHGFGGGNSSGHWLQHVLSELHCEVYIHDALSHYYDNEYRIIPHYGHVIPQEPISTLLTIREIDGRGWSHTNKITWQRVYVDPQAKPRFAHHIDDNDIHVNHLRRGFNRL
jgi:hypothetical protein